MMKKLRLQSKIKTFLIKNKVLIFIAFLGLVSRLYGIENKELWYDEVLDIHTSVMSVGEILNQARIAFLHYVIVHVFSLISTNIIFLRIPSVLFGVGSVAFLYFTVKKISDEKVALLTAFLMALSPMAIEFSQQILHYSYFIFFTIATLYFYFDLCFEKKLKLKTILLFLIFTFCNITSHLSAVLVTLIQIIFFIAYAGTHPNDFLKKTKLFLKYKINVVVTLISTILLLYFMLSIDYFKIFNTFLTFNPNAGLSLGYSLTSQLQTNVIRNYSLPFFKAMFIWLGNGDGVRLALYFTLFLIGSFALVVRKFWIFIFTQFWIFIPFLIIYITRTNHWFEEKYVIFIIPIYLFVIAYGLVTFIEFLFTKKNTTVLRNAIYLLLALLFIYLSILPIKTRTIYGYKVPGDPTYSWKKAIQEIQNNFEKPFILWASEDIFIKIYLGKENKGKTWFSEEDLIHLKPQEYDAIKDSRTNNYYISIPDVKDMRIGNIVRAEHKGVAGGFNLYKINFLRDRYVNFTGNYSEHFTKMDYLKDASDWSNVYMTYHTDRNANLALTEQKNLLYLAPSKLDKAYISYKFVLKPEHSNLYLRVVSLESEKNRLQIEVNGTAMDMLSASNVIKSGADSYKDITYDLSSFANSKTLNITFRFKPSQKPNESLKVALKSFGLFDQIDSNPLLNQTAENSFEFTSSLEVVKDKKWWYETIENFGWIQTKDGVLYRLSGSENDALIYRFTIPSGSAKGNFSVKSFTKNSSLTVSMSNDGILYDKVAEHVNELKDMDHSYVLNEKYLQSQSYLYVKIQTSRVGQNAVFRDLKIKFL